MFIRNFNPSENKVTCSIIWKGDQLHEKKDIICPFLRFEGEERDAIKMEIASESSSNVRNRMIIENGKRFSLNYFHIFS